MNLISQSLPYQPSSLEIYSRVRHLGHGLLLDSGTGYTDQLDVITAAPINTVELQESSGFAAALSTVRAQLQAHQCAGVDIPIAPGWFGVWSYRLGEVTESVRLKPGQLPYLWMGFYPAIILNDHSSQATRLVYLAGFEQEALRLRSALRCSPESVEAFNLEGPFSGNLSLPDYERRFRQVQHYIRQGDSYQINLSREFSAPYSGSPWQAYRLLRSEHSAPMGGYLETPDWALLSLSPERFIQSSGSQVETKPIKGTRPRSDDPQVDRDHRADLASSSKDRAENLMIVDLLRNDLGRSCVPGSVKVDQLFAVETFSSVHHLVSTVTGVLMSGVDPLDLLSGAFPGGSVTGAPKRRSMEIIEELEPHSRDFYCGSLLYLDVCGRLDSSILIRSLVAQDGNLRCWGGGGIVADSTCEAEYQEINDKIGKLLKTLQ
ncbi:aminodeoxychorismate synthase component I [Ketobacter sp.]|uniref:aminodeoxychorismate synthase component I n=1 Tax=Ketobacter sp. TaxID=2083498 RepID=UPI0025C4081D|nr:aminodeoxychorismate synthase component I [Ketobacter sp.]